MKLSIKKGSENYCCTVVEIDNLHPIEGADFIQRTLVYGNNVIIGKDIKEGDVMLYFNSGTKLNPEFCKFNNLYSNTEYNQNTTAKPGYLSYKQHRVKAIKLKGIISDGFLLPLSSLINFYNRIEVLAENGSNKHIIFNYGNDLLENDFKIGDTFTDVNGISICEKYIVAPPRNSNPGGHKPAVNKFNRLVDNQFYLHNDTENLRRNIHKINPNDIIGIHYKKHGTSAVFANIPTKRPLKWYEKLLQKLGVKIDNIIYDIIYSSRNVIKNKHINTETGAGFYGEDVWGVVAKEIKDLIPKNWTLYGEILGYLPSGAPIQKGYDYGCTNNIKFASDGTCTCNAATKCPNGRIGSSPRCTITEYPQHKFYVYKISVVNPDGKVIYLTDKQIEEYCEKVGLLYKDTFIYYGNIDNLLESKDFTDWDVLYKKDVKDTWQETLLDYLEYKYNEKDCYMCTNKVPEEGIVLRVEHLESYEAYKLKSKRFLLMESEAQEKDEIDIESLQ